MRKLALVKFVLINAVLAWCEVFLVPKIALCKDLMYLRISGVLGITQSRFYIVEVESACITRCLMNKGLLCSNWQNNLLYKNKCQLMVQIGILSFTLYVSRNPNNLVNRLFVWEKQSQLLHNTTTANGLFRGKSH